MIRLPARQNGQWTVTHNSDKLPDLSVTRNLSFDKEGYIRLSKPSASIYSESDSADFGFVLGMASGAIEGQWMVCTNEKQFVLDMYNSGNFGTLTMTVDTNVNTPDNTSSGTYLADMTFFNGLTTYSNPADQKLYTHDTSGSISNDWTVRDISASIEQNSMPVCLLASDNSIAVGNANQVDTFNTSYATGTQLQIPNDYVVTGIAYNNGYLGITTSHTTGSERSFFFVWDGTTTSANYSVEVPATSAFTPTPYMGSFIFVDGNGLLQYWTPSGLQVLASLPCYYSNTTLLNGGRGANPRASVNHAIKTVGEIIHINIKSVFAQADENQAIYTERQPAGVWTYDPAVGLYHRHAPAGVKATAETIATASVNTTTDVITVTTAPETGTPIRYSDGTGTAIAGLTNRKVYYCIYVTATTIKLAETSALATAGTAIDLTGTGNANQTLQFYPKSSFGNSYVDEKKQGAIHLESNKTSTSDFYYQSMFFGSTAGINSTTEYDQLNMVLQDTENRGHFITSKLLSAQLQDTWSKLYLKHKNLSTEFDKIIVKYRTDNNEPLTRIKETTDGVITWTDSDTFTTTDAQWADVLADDEVEIIQGTGAGYLAHVSSISEAGGTYTVNIDETIKNLTATETGRAVASRWIKLNAFDSTSLPNDEGYFEVVLGKKSKSIQFKVELRGENVEIEEILVANELFRQA